MGVGSSKLAGRADMSAYMVCLRRWCGGVLFVVQRQAFCTPAVVVRGAMHLACQSQSVTCMHGFRRAVHKRSDSARAQTQGVVGILLASPLARVEAFTALPPVQSCTTRCQSEIALEARCAHSGVRLHTVASRVERTAAAGGARRSWSTDRKSVV